MPTAERGPGEKRFVVRVVREVGDDPPDAQPAGAQGDGCRVPLPYCCINPLMGQTVRGIVSVLQTQLSCCQSSIFSMMVKASVPNGRRTFRTPCRTCLASSSLTE